MATMETNVLDVQDRHAFRKWLAQHGATERECWVAVKRGKPQDGVFAYLDAVEEALCFGWIDSTTKMVNGVRMQRFTPRKKNSPWTELNKARVRRLESLGMMTDAGRAVVPPMTQDDGIDRDVRAALEAAQVWTIFCTMPPLYQRVRAYNVAFYRQRDPAQYDKALVHLIDETRKGHLYGQWNDYGRLPDD